MERKRMEEKGTERDRTKLNGKEKGDETKRNGKERK
jgi:hypothetical protein